MSVANDLALLRDAIAELHETAGWLSDARESDLSQIGANAAERAFDRLSFKPGTIVDLGYPQDVAILALEAYIAQRLQHMSKETRENTLVFQVVRALRSTGAARARAAAAIKAVLA